MNQSKVFLDANIILEIIYKRAKADLSVDLIRQHSNLSYISVLTVHLVMHFGLKVSPLESLKTLLSDHTVLPLTSEDTDWAFTNMRNNDFEDALQLSIAISAGCHEFMTFDKQLYETYKTLPQIRVVLL